MAYTESQIILLHWVTLTAAILSVFGSAFMLVSFFLFGKGKGLTRLVIFLAFGDFGWSVSVAINHALLLKYSKLEDTWCFISFLPLGLFQFFAGSTVFWTLCIAVYLYLTVFRMKSLTINEHASEKKRETATMVMFHIIAWGEPLGILIYCYSADLFAQTNNGVGLCYPNNNFVHFWCWFFPIIVCFGASLVVYVMLVAKLASITSWKFVFRTFTRHTTTLSLPFRVSVYLLIFLICWSLDILQFIDEVYILSKTKADAERDYVILVIYSILLQLQGAFDCIVYGLSNKEFRTQHSYFIDRWGSLGPLLMAVFVLLCPLLVIPTFAMRVYRNLTTSEPDQTPLIPNDPEQ